MFFFFSKLFAFLEMPLSWIIILLLLAIFDRRQGRKKKWLVASLIVTCLFGNETLFNFAMRHWESAPREIPDGTKPYSAAIVLSGVIQYDAQYDRLQLTRRSDRLLHAIELYKQGKVQKILIAGGSGSMENGRTHENLRLIPLLRELGVEENDVMIEGSSGNTRENARLCKTILDRDFPGGTFLLFTSGYHMPRAVKCFEKAGIRVDPYPTDLYSGKFKIEIEKLFIPNAETLFNWETLTHEWIGFFVYRVMGYC